MQFSSFLRVTGISLALTTGVMAAACSGDDDKLKVDVKSAADGGNEQPDAEQEQEQEQGQEPKEKSASAPRAANAAADSNDGWCAARSVLHSACTTCHNEQKVAGAPMSLSTYDDLQKPAVSDKSRKVYELVKERIHDDKRPMPPQMKLTDKQLASLDKWIEAGASAGSDASCGESEASTETAANAAFEWPDNCDATYRITAHAEGSEDAPFMVGGGQEIHPQVYVDAPWGDETVQAIAWRSISDNVSVLHHWILYGANREFLVGWAPGKDGALMKEDVGMLLVGGKLRLDMHYNNLASDKEQADNSGVELCVVTKDHFRKNTATVAQTLGAFSINLPPRSNNVDVTSTCTFTGEQPITLLTASPHAHRMAKHMKFTLEHAGEKIVMHDQGFHFEEQGQFELDKPLTVSKGDKLITTCTYDNDTDQTVTFGENTGNEMCFNFALYYPSGGLKCSFQ